MQLRLLAAQQVHSRDVRSGTEVPTSLGHNSPQDEQFCERQTGGLLPCPVPLAVVGKQLLARVNVAESDDIGTSIVRPLVERDVVPQRVSAVVDEPRQTPRGLTSIDVCESAEPHQIALVGRPHGLCCRTQLA